MGNRITQTLDKWGVHPRKLNLNRSMKGGSHKVSSRKTVVTHTSNNKFVEPEYAKVNKRKTPVSEGLHYAEIQVLQSEIESKPRVTQQSTSTTEYATIDFLKSIVGNAPHDSADILIPPGELQRPKSQRVRGTSSQRLAKV